MSEFASQLIEDSFNRLSKKGHTPIVINGVQIRAVAKNGVIVDYWPKTSSWEITGTNHRQFDMTRFWQTLNRKNT